MSVLCIVKLETPQLKGLKSQGDSAIEKLANYSLTGDPYSNPCEPMCVIFSKTKLCRVGW